MLMKKILILFYTLFAYDMNNLKYICIYTYPGFDEIILREGREKNRYPYYISIIILQKY